MIATSGVRSPKIKSRSCRCSRWRIDVFCRYAADVFAFQLRLQFKQPAKRSRVARNKATEENALASRTSAT
jgi:hypothetical protein